MSFLMVALKNLRYTKVKTPSCFCMHIVAHIFVWVCMRFPLWFLGIGFVERYLVPRLISSIVLQCTQLVANNCSTICLPSSWLQLHFVCKFLFDQGIDLCYKLHAYSMQDEQLERSKVNELMEELRLKIAQKDLLLQEFSKSKVGLTHSVSYYILILLPTLMVMVNTQCCRGKETQLLSLLSSVVEGKRHSYYPVL